MAVREWKFNALQSTVDTAISSGNVGRFCFMDIEDIKQEIKRRLSFVHDALIGQSPEDLERHYKLIGKQDAFKGMLKFIEDGNGANIQN